MMNNEKKLILGTLKTLFELQLRGVRQLLGEEDIEMKLPRKRGVRRQSLVDCVVKLLTQEKRDLHVNEMVTLLRERFGRVTDRDTISSALAKKARQGVLVQQTAPALFGLIETDQPVNEVSTSENNHDVTPGNREGERR